MKIETRKKILRATEQGYDLIAEKFSATRKNFWSDLRFIADFTQKGNKVLDYGCGNGRLLEILPQNIDYFGVDISGRLIELARKKYSNTSNQIAFQRKLNFQKISSSKVILPFENNFFDVIYSIAVFHHLPDKQYRFQILKELKRVLKPKGYLIISVWNLWQNPYYKKIIQNWKNKFFGKSKLDWNDCFIDFKDNQNKVFSRFHHAFSQRELENLFQKNNFQNIQIQKIQNKNLLIIGKK